MRRLEGLEARMLAAPDQQISLTDPDSRSMATSGRGSGVVGYNVQVAVDTDHHLIVTHEVTNVGSDRAQLARVAKETKAALQTDTLEGVADRGYFSGEEILPCDQAGITVTLPKPVTSGIMAKGRYGKQDFVYLPAADVYRCPAGERLKYYYTNVENGLRLRRYWTTACRTCALKSRCTTGVQRRITRWEHEDVLEAVQKRLDENPQAMRRRRETVEHPFGTIKARMGATHFLMKTLPRVAAEMALHVLAYNLTRVMNIMGARPLMAAMRALGSQIRVRLLLQNPKRRLESASGALPDRKSHQTRKNHCACQPREVATRLCFRRSVFTRPRPEAVIRICKPASTMDGMPPFGVPLTRRRPALGHDAGHGNSTILPPSPPASMRACTSRAAARGRRSMTTGWMAPPRSRPKRIAMSALNSSGCVNRRAVML
jgi:hypothetical protein